MDSSSPISFIKTPSEIEVKFKSGIDEDDEAYKFFRGTITKINNIDVDEDNGKFINCSIIFDDGDEVEHSILYDKDFESETNDSWKFADEKSQLIKYIVENKKDIQSLQDAMARFVDKFYKEEEEDHEDAYYEMEDDDDDDDEDDDDDDDDEDDDDEDDEEDEDDEDDEEVIIIEEDSESEDIKYEGRYETSDDDSVYTFVKVKKTRPNWKNFFGGFIAGIISIGTIATFLASIS